MNSYRVDRERWARMSILEQMGNIYSEVGRSLQARRRGDSQGQEAAMIRALDLFDATTELLVSEKSPRSREVLRARDQYVSLFYDASLSNTEQSLEKYFMQYALAARNNH